MATSSPPAHSFRRCCSTMSRPWPSPSHFGPPSATGAGIEDAAARALATMRQVLPSRLRGESTTFELAAMPAGADPQADPGAARDRRRDPGTAGAAVRLRTAGNAARATRRTAAAAPGRTPPPGDAGGPVVSRCLGAPAYGLAHLPRRPHQPSGRRTAPSSFPARSPAGTSAPSSRRGSRVPTVGDAWPCLGEVIIDLPAAEVLPFAGDGVVQPIGPDRCRLRLGAWSWPGLAASLARFDADIEVLDPPELRAAFTALARRATRAADGRPNLSR